MARTTQSQSNHDWMVAELAKALTNRGHQNIRADHINHPNGRPQQLGDHIPDVTAYHNQTGSLIIGEVETSDSIDTDHTYSQLHTFRQAANQLGGYLHVGLPFRSDLDAAKRIVDSWGIKVDQWWYGVES